MLSSTSFDCLPEEICVDICAKVIGQSNDPIKDITKLESVSKLFQRVCYHPIVLENIPFVGSPFDRPYYPFYKYMKYIQIYPKCLEVRNPEAMYREGFMQYFTYQQAEGLDLLAHAASKGIKEAEFFYAVILLCLGGEGKKKGMLMLATFVKPLVDNTIYWMRETNAGYWLYDIMLDCQAMVKHLKRSYVRDQCNCDGVKEGLADNHGLYCQWDRLIRSTTLIDLLSSSSCQICLCHHVLQLFFDLTED